MIKVNTNKMIKYVEIGEYGNVLDNLLDHEDQYLKNFNSEQISNYCLLKGILWELLGNLPKAKINYEIALDKNPKNILSLQYLAHILSTKGDYPKSIDLFKKFFRIRKDGFNPFEINRGFLGFRYRENDIKLLEKLELNEEHANLRDILLSIYYLSVYDLKGSLLNFRKIKHPDSTLKILELITNFLHSKDIKIIEQLASFKLSEANELFKNINTLLRELLLKEYKLLMSSFEYNPKVSEHLYKLTDYVQGWLDYCEGNLLYQISKNLKKSKNTSTYVVEIGSFLGRSSIFIAQGLKKRGEGILLSIDPHNGIPYYHPEPTIDDFKKNITEKGLSNYIQILKGTSEEWSSKIKDVISMIFIDGDHSYDMVKSDFLNWESKLIEEGFIAFHDAVLDGPFKLILEILDFNKWNFLIIVGNIAVLKKNKEEEDDKLKIDLISILNLILLHINHLFHLDFMKNDEISMKNQLITLLNDLEQK